MFSTLNCFISSSALAAWSSSCLTVSSSCHIILFVPTALTWFLPFPGLALNRRSTLLGLGGLLSLVHSLTPWFAIVSDSLAAGCPFSFKNGCNFLLKRLSTFSVLSTSLSLLGFSSVMIQPWHIHFPHGPCLSHHFLTFPYLQRERLCHLHLQVPCKCFSCLEIRCWIQINKI